MVYYLPSPEWWVWVFQCCNWAILSDRRLPLNDLTISSAVLVLMFHQKMSSFKEYGYTFKVDCFGKKSVFLNSLAWESLKNSSAFQLKERTEWINATFWKKKTNNKTKITFTFAIKRKKILFIKLAFAFYLSSQKLTDYPFYKTFCTCR